MMKRLKATVIGAATVFALAFTGAQAHAQTAIVVGGTTVPEAEYITRNLHGYDDVRVIDYPASVIFPWYDVSVEVGKDRLRESLEDTDGDVTVIGYSQGARIAGDVLAEPQRDGVTGVLYADPRRAGHGIETQLPFDLPGATMTGERDSFSVPVVDHCAPFDGVCNWRNDDPLGSIAGYIRSHTTYFD